MGFTTPGAGATHPLPAFGTEPWSGSDFGFPASSPGRPGACGWVREASHLFSVRGTIRQIQLRRSSRRHWGQWGLPSTANQCGGGQGGLMNMQIEAGLVGCPLPSPIPTPTQMLRRASSERTFLKCHLFCCCLRIHRAS